MITIEMLTGAIYTFIGLSALIVILTQVFKDLFKSAKRWQNHLIAFGTSLIACGIVLLIGIFGHVGLFAAFCVKCFSSWLMFVGIVIACTFMANGQWTYDVAKKFLELIGLLAKEPVPEEENKPETPSAE